MTLKADLKAYEEKLHLQNLAIQKQEQLIQEGKEEVAFYKGEYARREGITE